MEIPILTAPAFLWCELKAVKVISDPKVFELLADDTRRRMINLLRAKELTVSQIASELGKTPQAIYHHIRKLLEGGLIEAAREERVENFVETYYRASAESFEITHGERGDEELDEGEVREVLNSLANIGLVRKADEQTVSRAVKLLKRVRAIGLNPKQAEKIEKLEDPNMFLKLHAADYARLLFFTDKQFDEYQSLQKELRELLKSRKAG